MRLLKINLKKSIRILCERGSKANQLLAFVSVFFGEMGLVMKASFSTAPAYLWPRAAGPGFRLASTTVPLTENYILYCGYSADFQLVACINESLCNDSPSLGLAG
jgi:hypothetical protein